jgi:preprotein translocase subunit SecE
MKLSEKKNEISGKNVQSIEAGKKTLAKPAVSRLSRLKKAEVPKKAVKKPAGTVVVWVDSARTYIREVVVELKKVIWPSRKETVGSTAVVLVIVGLVAVYLGIVDLILSRLVKLLVG